MWVTISDCLFIEQIYLLKLIYDFWFSDRMSNNNSTSGSGQSRKTRTNLEKRDADILCQILNTLNDGHVWKIIKEGVGTKQEMFFA